MRRRMLVAHFLGHVVRPHDGDGNRAPGGARWGTRPIPPPRHKDRRPCACSTQPRGASTRDGGRRPALRRGVSALGKTRALRAFRRPRGSPLRRGRVPRRGSRRKRRRREDPPRGPLRAAVRPEEPAHRSRDHREVQVLGGRGEGEQKLWESPPPRSPPRACAPAPRVGRERLAHGSRARFGAREGSRRREVAGSDARRSRTNVAGRGGRGDVGRGASRPRAVDRVS